MPRLLRILIVLIGGAILSSCTNVLSASSGPGASAAITGCLVDSTCDVVGETEIPLGTLQVVSTGENATAVVLLHAGAPESVLQYTHPVEGTGLLECLQLGSDTVCVFQDGGRLHRNRSIFFAVTDGEVTQIAGPTESFAPFSLSPLNAHQVMAWTWTSAAGVGNPSDDGPTAWQTWTLSTSELLLTGCGPSVSGGNSSGPAPDQPLDLECP